MDAAVTLSVYQLLEATWPDVNKNLSEGDADRLDWLRAIREFRNTGAGLLRTPFSVVAFGRKVETPRGGICNREYDWPLSVALVVAIGTAETTEAFLMSHMESWTTALRGATMAVNNFQLIGEPSHDYHPKNMANEILEKANLPFMAVVHDAVLRVGETSS